MRRLIGYIPARGACLVGNSNSPGVRVDCFFHRSYSTISGFFRSLQAATNTSSSDRQITKQE
ncbi:MAG: hypothetical protein V7K53_20630 [Nostoc sp.]|uniref:hypothetical protein n=1 Tax=Nostoc sp. TaxID=1180 RepID=UPI002FFC4677